MRTLQWDAITSGVILLAIPISVITLFTAIPVAGGLIAELIKWWRKKLANRGRMEAKDNAG